MPFDFFSNLQTEANESRERIGRLAEGVNLKAQHINNLHERLRGRQQDVRHLIESCPALSQPGARLVAALLIGTLFLALWYIDFVLLGSYSEFVLDLAQISEAKRIPMRVALSVLWALFGYSIGIHLGSRKKSREFSTELVFSIALAFIYALAVPTVAVMTAGFVFDGKTKWTPLPFALGASLYPLVCGTTSSSALAYLFTWLRLAFLKQRERSLARRVLSCGTGLIRESTRLAEQVREHQRLYGERVEPHLTHLAQDFIEKYSRGSVTVNFGPNRQLPVATPESFPAPESSTGPGLAIEEPTPPGGGLRSSESGVGVREEARAQTMPEATEIEHLRAQLMQRAEHEDAELSPRNGFSAPLPK